MSSLIDWMKHAEHWGGSRTPTLNQTGLLNAAICWTMRYQRLSSNVVASSGVSR